MTISRKKAIETQCWQCCGYYSDGKIDCEVINCPLYPFMPYRKLTPDLSIYEYNPRHVGKKTLEETKKELTEEQKNKLRENLKNIKKRKN